jgi:dephospho-CoA kinase
MLRVALTGGIASGKSYVRQRLSAHGVPTIDADALVHEALCAGSAATARIAARFGHAVLAGDGSVDRRALAALVFADSTSRTDLEAILHPEVFRRIDEWFTLLSSRVRSPESGVRSPDVGPQTSDIGPRTSDIGPRTSDIGPRTSDDVPFAVADIPLLFETHHEGLFDRVIVAVCSPAKQVERLRARNGLSEEEARQRLQAQWPIMDKVRGAHYVVDTNGTFEETDAQVDRILTELADDAENSL